MKNGLRAECVVNLALYSSRRPSLLPVSPPELYGSQQLSAGVCPSASARSPQLHTHNTLLSRTVRAIHLCIKMLF